MTRGVFVLIGLFMLSGAGVKGAVLHTIFHAVIKTGLFLTAGAIIVRTERTEVSDLYGIGKKMPVTIWCFTFFALALVGIPPFSGFVSKWYLADAAISSGLNVVSWLAPVILLISALLTAGYLLTITVNGFFPGSLSAWNAPLFSHISYILSSKSFGSYVLARFLFRFWIIQGFRRNRSIS